MPISMSDPFVRAEVVPPAISAMRAPLCTHYNVPNTNFGDRGNEYHSSGYHRSRRWVLLSPDSRYGTRDYSVQNSLDHSGDENWISAFDFTPAVWGTARNRATMVEITNRVLDAARRNDSRLSSLREFAGTIDGRTVITFSCQGGGPRTPFDSTHLDHVHGSFWRGRADDNHQGILDVMLGTTSEDDDMGASFGPITIERDGTTSLCIPPVQAGLADPRQCWLNVGGDLSGPAVLRVWYCKGDGAWFPMGGPLVGTGAHAGWITLYNGQVFSQEIPAGVRLVSISRKAIGSDGFACEPSAEAPAYPGHLTCCIERS